MWSLFKELRLHNKLAAQRNPMFEKNKFAKFFLFFGGLFWVGYLIFLGVIIAFALKKSIINLEAYQALNTILPLVLSLDFLMRFPLQKPPTQEITPYLLLPIKKKQVIDFLLLRSLPHFINFFWFCFFIPFALITVTYTYGLSGVILYNLGIWLLILVNNYWYILCRLLINEKTIWVLLPTLFYLALGLLIFLPDQSPIGYFFRALGDYLIEGRLVAYIGVLGCIIALFFINRVVVSKLIYSETSKSQDSTKVLTISSYSYLERFGEIGEFMRLELKLLLRNKRCRVSLRSIAFLVVIFSLLISFTPAYDGKFTSNFFAFYAFISFGTVILTYIMSYEGNYMDGLMTRKESILNLLKAKYYTYSLGALIPFVLMIPAVVMNKISLLKLCSFALFTVGFVYFFLFQLAVYNTKTIPLNVTTSSRQSSTGLQTLVSISVLFAPLLLHRGIELFFEETTSLWILLGIGLSFILTSSLWIKNIYRRFMMRRYKNMDEFRNTREG